MKMTRQIKAARVLATVFAAMFVSSVAVATAVAPATEYSATLA